MAQLQIMDASGKIVMAKQTSISTGSNNISINGLSNLQTGLYVVRLTVNAVLVATEKIMKR